PDYCYYFTRAATSPSAPLSLHDALPISDRSARRPTVGDASNIIVGTAGKAYRAEVGATFPTGPEEPWGSDFTDMGFITPDGLEEDRKSTRLNSSHVKISYAVFCLKKKKQ